MLVLGWPCALYVSRPVCASMFSHLLVWPYCNAAKRLSSVAMTSTDWSQWDKLQWRRRLETFGDNDASVLATGPNGDFDAVWYALTATVIIAGRLTLTIQQSWRVD